METTKKSFEEMREQTTTTKNPVYTGKISDGLQNSIGTIAVWAEEQRTETSPLFVGKIEVDGVRYRVALWKFVPKK